MIWSKNFCDGCNGLEYVFYQVLSLKFALAIWQALIGAWIILIQADKYALSSVPLNWKYTCLISTVTANFLVKL